MLEGGILLILGSSLITLGALVIIVLWQNSSTRFRSSQAGTEFAAGSKTGLAPEQKRILLFVLTFVFGLCLAALGLSLRLGGQDGSLSFKRFQDDFLLLTAWAPMSILLFPTGLAAYFPVSFIGKFFLVLLAWIFYFVAPTYGIEVEKRWFAIVYTVLVVILIFNVAGCGLFGLEIWSALPDFNPD